MLYSCSRLGSLDDDLLYRPASSIKYSSRAVSAAVAASLFVGASLLATSPATAQEFASNPPACDTLRDSTASIKCSIKQLDERNAAAKAQVQAEALLKQCLFQIAAFKKAQPALFEKLGTVTRENACQIAAKLPRVSASLN